MSKDLLIIDIAQQLIDIAEKLITLSGMQDQNDDMSVTPKQNDFTKEKQRILKAIRSSPDKRVSKREALRITQNISKKQRDSIINSMIDDGEIYHRQIRINGSQRSSTCYFINRNK